MAELMLNQMTNSDLEDFGCRVKDAICAAMELDGTLEAEVARAWTREHIIVLRKPHLITRLFNHLRGRDTQLLLVALIVGDVESAGKTNSELNAAVAERIMGCTVVYRKGEADKWIPLCGCERKYRDSLKPHEKERNALKRYSSDIAAAWEVVVRFANMNLSKRQELHDRFAEEMGHLGWVERERAFCRRVCEVALQVVGEDDG